MEKVKHHLGSCVPLILKELCSPGGWFPLLNENPPDRNVDWNTPGSHCQTLTFCLLNQHCRQQKSIFFCLETVSSHKTKQSKSNYLFVGDYTETHLFSLKSVIKGNYSQLFFVLWFLMFYQEVLDGDSVFSILIIHSILPV